MELKGTSVEGIACRNISSHTEYCSGAEGHEERDERRELGLEASRTQSCCSALAHTTAEAEILTFLACSFWGAVSESVGRRWALMIPTFIALFLIPLYITQVDRTLFLGFFLLFICFFSGKDALNPGWLSERFPTEVRATASGFIYHQGAVWGAAVAPILTYFAVNQGMGFAKPMMYGTIGSLVVYIIAVYLGPETKGMVMTADLEVIEAEVTLV